MALIFIFFIYFMLIFSFQLNHFDIVMLGEFLKKHPTTFQLLEPKLKSDIKNRSQNRVCSTWKIAYF